MFKRNLYKKKGSKKRRTQGTNNTGKNIVYVFVNIHKVQTNNHSAIKTKLKSFATAEAPCEDKEEEPQRTTTTKTKTKTMAKDEGKVCSK